ncbi:MAG: divalent cation tolerance protein CutA [Bacteroidetes bacterium]|nr:divalent cation tolerance protein CutA [Bacteroidota bacterium]
MVNIIIYLNKNDSAMELVKFLLEEKLIASATIDENNISYKLENKVFSEEIFTVITAQTKSLLFSDIVKAVETKAGKNISIISTPIVGSNGIFDDTVRTKTIAI